MPVLGSDLQAPAWAAVSALGVAAWQWSALLPATLQVSAFLAAAAFSGIESTWYAVTTEQPDGQLRFTPFAKTCRKPHTTWEQFWANVLYTPLLLHAYRALVPNACLRVVLFPLNVWLLEAVEGYGLMAVYGRNPAWTYDGRDAFLHGNIKLSFGPQWLGLGIAVELVYDYLLALSAVIAEACPCAVGYMALAAFLLCTGTYHVTRRTVLLEADADEVWAAAKSPADINAELFPLMQMTFPAGRSLDLAEPVSGDDEPVPLCYSVLMLFGLLPVDISRVTLEEFDDDHRCFIERSPMLSMSHWQHSRAVDAEDDSGRVEISDELIFKPRFAGVAVAAFVRLLFAVRHWQLGRRWS